MSELQATDYSLDVQAVIFSIGADNQYTMADTSEHSSSGDSNIGYIKTSTGNYVSRQAEIVNPANVEIKGKSWVQSGVTIRGDAARIRMGRYCALSSGVVLEPALLVGGSGVSEQQQHVPLSIGSHTIIEANARISAAAVGSYCWIGPNVTLGPRVIIKDGCIIDQGVSIGADIVIPPFTRVSVQKNSLVLQQRELPPSTVQLLQEESMENYQAFVGALKSGQ